MTQKLFVTGATGVLGRAVIPLLVAEGHDVLAVARSDATAAQLREQGADGVAVDLFNADAVASAVSGRDAVLHLATHIPTGASGAVRRGWATNDRLRRDASRLLAAAAIDAGAARYIGESITFPYADGGDEWIDEARALQCSPANATVLDAEASAARVTDAGAVGITLRFAMFWSADSAHIAMFRTTAKRGVCAIVGPLDAYTSFVHISDAAAAVVAALGAPPGVYNVAEPHPARRAEHRDALAAAVGRSRLRSIPKPMVAAGGAALESLTRSQRIASGRLIEATSWAPKVGVVGQWGTLS